MTIMELLVEHPFQFVTTTSDGEPSRVELGTCPDPECNGHPVLRIYNGPQAPGEWSEVNLDNLPGATSTLAKAFASWIDHGTWWPRHEGLRALAYLGAWCQIYAELMASAAEGPIH